MTSSSNIPKRIVELNDNAVSYISQGNHRAASTTLNLALSQVKLLMEQNAWRPKEENILPAVYPISYNDIYHRTKHCEGTNVPFFNRAFRMSNIVSSDDQDRFTAVLLFNLALVHHDQGIESGSSNDLVIAMKYYKFALRVINEAGIDMGLESLYLLILAIWNNMANIHSFSCNISEA